jgi:hypothetical protein
MAVLKQLTRLVLPLCLAAYPLAGCQAPLAPPTATAVAGVVVAGDRALSVKPTLGGYRTQGLVRAYDKASIAHLLLELWVVTVDGEGVEHEARALDANGAPITRDVTDLDAAVTFAGLKRHTTYRVKAVAYKAAGFSDSDVISTRDGDSAVTITLTDDDAPAMAPLKVRLIARDVSMRLSGTAGAYADALSEVVTFDAQNPKVAYSSRTHQHLLVWQDARHGTNIYVRLMNTDGTPAGADFALTSVPSGQSNPAVAYNSESNEFLVTWQDTRNGNYDIYGQRVSATGTLIAGAFVISNASSHQINPAVAYNSEANEFLVTWQDIRSGNYDIYGQRVDATGTLTAGAFIISNAPGYQINPEIAYNSESKEFLVAWQDPRNGNDDIYGQRVDASGSLTAGNFVISNASSYQTSPSVAYNSQSKEFLIAWQDMRSGNLDIYGQRVDAAGSLTAGNFVISNASRTQANPAIAYNSASNEFLVAWQDDRNGDADIYGQWVDATGTLTGTGNFAVCTASRTQTNAAVAYSSQTNEFLVTWQDTRAGHMLRAGRMDLSRDIYFTRVGTSFTPDQGTPLGGAMQPASQANQALAYNGRTNQHLLVWHDTRNGIDNFDIYGRLVSADGTPEGADFVISNASSAQANPAIAYNSASNEFLVAWQDSRNGNDDIYGQRVSATGSLTAGNFVISNASSSQTNPSVAYSSESNAFLVAWQDSRNGNYDIYSQRVDASGTLTGGNFAVCTNASSQANPSVAYSSASNAFLVAWADRRSGNYDIYGQRVDAAGSLTAGNFVISNASSAQANPAIAYNSASNEFLVAWQDSRNGNDDIYGQRVDATGTLTGGNFAVCTNANYQFNLSMAYSSQANEFLVAWEDYRNGNADIYGQRVSAAGMLVGTTSFAIGITLSDQTHSSMAYNSQTNEFLVTWEDWLDGRVDANETPLTDIYGQRVESFCLN